MPVTTLLNVINPSVFTPYVINRTMELSALFQAGIVATDAQIDALAGGPGPVVNMPFWADLSGESETMTEEDIDATNIAADEDVAVIIRRVKAWGATGLAGVLAGDDPMRAIGDLVAGFWARDMQKELIAVLKGAFAAASSATNVHDISGGVEGAALWSTGAFVDAQAKLGDASGLLTGVAMHSAVYHALKKLEKIAVERDSAGKDFASYDGRRVIVDDGCPVAAGVYTSYLFGQGAVALGNGNPPTIQATEVHREAMTGSGEDVLINRKNFILHPRGIKFKGSIAKSGPTRVQLGTGTNWERVYEPKQIRVVAFKHKI